MLSSPVSSSSSSWLGVSSSASSWRGCAWVSGWSESCSNWPLILMRIGELADRYTSDAPFSDISRSTRSMFPVLIPFLPAADRGDCATRLLPRRRANW